MSGQGIVANADSEEPVLRDMCHAMWERLKPSTREQFFWPAPGETLTPRAEDFAAASEKQSTEGLAAESTKMLLDEANFSVIVVLPEAVDELRLGGKQRRNLYRLAAREADDALEDDTVARRLQRWSVAEWDQVAVNP